MGTSLSPWAFILLLAEARGAASFPRGAHAQSPSLPCPESAGSRAGARQDRGANATLLRRTRQRLPALLALPGTQETSGFCTDGGKGSGGAAGRAAGFGSWEGHSAGGEEAGLCERFLLKPRAAKQPVTSPSISRDGASGALGRSARLALRGDPVRQTNPSFSSQIPEDPSPSPHPCAGQEQRGHVCSPWAVSAVTLHRQAEGAGCVWLRQRKPERVSRG